MSEQMLLDIPFEIPTRRMLLRTPRPGDGAQVCRSVIASLPELKQWMLWATDGYLEKDAELWCRRSAGQFHLRSEIAYLLLFNAEHVGTLSLFNFDWKVCSCEIGYWLSTPRCGDGLMTEAVSAAVASAVDAMKMQRLVITTDDRNQRSAAVAQRCGFKLEGILRRHRRNNYGALSDTRVYAMLFEGNETSQKIELRQ